MESLVERAFFDTFVETRLDAPDSKPTFAAVLIAITQAGIGPAPALRHHRFEQTLRAEVWFVPLKPGPPIGPLAVELTAVRAGDFETFEKIAFASLNGVALTLDKRANAEVVTEAFVPLRDECQRALDVTERL